jgi:hypothetical protein
MHPFPWSRRRVNISSVEAARSVADGRRRTIAWGLWGLTLVLLVAVFALGTLNGGAIDAEEVIFSLIPILAVGTSSTVGAMVASRHPANPIGWLFLMFPAGLLLGILAEEYAQPVSGWHGWSDGHRSRPS